MSWLGQAWLITGSSSPLLDSGLGICSWQMLALFNNKDGSEDAWISGQRLSVPGPIISLRPCAACPNPEWNNGRISGTGSEWGITISKLYLFYWLGKSGWYECNKTQGHRNPIAKYCFCSVPCNSKSFLYWSESHFQVTLHRSKNLRGHFLEFVTSASLVSMPGHLEWRHVLCTTPFASLQKNTDHAFPGMPVQDNRVLRGHSQMSKFR